MNRGKCLVLLATLLIFSGTFYSVSITSEGHNFENIENSSEEGLYLVWQSNYKGNIIRDYGEMKLVYAKEKDLLKAKIIYQPANHMKYIGLKNLIFDPLSEPPNVPREFNKQKTKLGIVQFIGPPTIEDIKELGRLGKIIHYIPHNAYLIYIEDLDAIKNIKNIRWFGKFHPYFKIDSELYREYLKSISTTSSYYSKYAEKRGNFIPATIITYEKPLTTKSFKELRHFKFDDKYYYYGFLDIKRLKEISFEDHILYIGKYVEPELFDEMSTELVGGSYGNFGCLVHKYLLTGYGVIVAVADTGIDTGSSGITHPDLKDRVVGIWDASGGDGHDGYGHGTHCAGIIAGNSNLRFYYPEASIDEYGYYYGLGVAPQAKLVGQKIFSDTGTWLGANPVDLAVFAQIKGATISSNSWGAAVNGIYDDFSMIYDALTRDSNPYLHGEQQILYVFAAGNSGPGIGTVGSPGTAKNVITVGACENNRFGNYYMNIADFSSRGPTVDGRIKPDVVAPGTWVSSALSQAAVPGWGWGNINKWYEWCGGTSMATPHVSGAAALFVQYYKGIYGKNPSPAMIKAALIVSAIDLNGTYSSEPIPNYNEGWGMIYLPNIINPPHGELFLDSPANLTVGSKYIYHIYVDDNTVPLKITLAYTDREGIPFSSPALVNDLNLIVKDPAGNIYVGNVFRDGWSVPGNFSADNINNVECVYIRNPRIGKYTIEVQAVNIPMDSVPSTPETDQDFSIAIIGGINVTLHYSSVEFEKNTYKPNDYATLIAFDYFANENSNYKDTVSVKLSSLAGDSEEIVLQEIDKDVGIFKGKIILTVSSPVPNNGRLEVFNSDTIKATYLDYLGHYRSDETIVDGLKPVILDIKVEEISSYSATVKVETSEPTLVRLHYGLQNKIVNVLESDFNLQHSIYIRSLEPYTEYYFYVYVEDLAGNFLIDDNSTNYYRFRTSMLADILLVADDDGKYQISSALIEYQLRKLGLKADIWDVSKDGSPSNIIMSYPVVIWNCGPAWSNTLSEDDQKMLSKYLDGGGRLLLLGQDILYDIGITQFFSRYFYIIDYYEDAIIGYECIVYGVSNNPITGDYTSGLNLSSTYYLYIDEIYLSSNAPASPIFLDEYGEAIGVMVNRNYRAIYMAFPYECLVIEEENATLKITNKIIRWLTEGIKDCISIYANPSTWIEPNRTYKLDVLVINKDNVAHTINVSFNVYKYDFPPLIAIIKPSRGEILSDIINVEILAKDDHGITKIEIYVDNVMISTLTSPPYIIQLNTKNYKNGRHTIKAVGYDTANQFSEHEIEVLFFNINLVDSFGYRSMPNNYSWIKVREDPNAVFVGGGDDASYMINLPFTFRYYNIYTTRIYVCTNGFISFTSSTAYNNVDLPTTTIKDLIAVFWDDLRAYTLDQGIYMVTKNINSRKCVVIEWYIQRYGAQTGYILNFEAILFESGEIILNYNNTYVGKIDYNYGANATVGIQSESGSGGKYILISYNMAVIKNSTSIRFKPPWITPFGSDLESVAQAVENSLNNLDSRATPIISKNVSVSIPPNSAVWISFDWKPTNEGVYTISINVDKVLNETFTVNNRIQYDMYVRSLKGILKVGIIDSWGADYYTYTSLGEIEKSWYKYGNYKLVFDYVTLNKEKISLRDILSSNVNVLMISNAWSFEYGWNFSEDEIRNIESAVLLGYGIVATAGTLSSSFVKENMLLGFLFGIDHRLGGIWSDEISSLIIKDITHPIFDGLPPTFNVGYGMACTGLKNTTGKIIAETDKGIYTKYKGIMTINNYGDSCAIYIPYLVEFMYSNELDRKLLYNSIIYSHRNSAQIDQDIVVLKVAPEREWIKPGNTVKIDISLYNPGYLTTSGRLVLRAIYGSFSYEIASKIISIQPASYYNDTLIFAPVEEGRITLMLEVHSYTDKTPHNNVGYSTVYCRKPKETILVAGLDSLGFKFPEIMIWDELEQHWYRYGNYKVVFNLRSLVDKNVTYDDIKSTNADVLIISDAWRNIPSYNIWWEFNDIEIEAIKRYVMEGHGLIMTSGTLHIGVPNNMKLAPLAGLSDKAQQRWAASFNGIFVINFTPTASKYIFDNISSPYLSNMKYTAFNWVVNASDPADILARSTDKLAGIFYHKYGLGSVIYFSHIPEHIDGNMSDRQLVYNAIVFTYINSTQPINDTSPPIVNIVTLKDGDIVNDIIEIKVRAIDNESYITNITIEITNSTDKITLYPKYDYSTYLSTCRFDTKILCDGEYLIKAIASDKHGNSAESEIRIIVDNTPPSLRILYPLNNAIIYQSDILVRWEVSDANLDHLEISIDGSKFINIGITSSYHVYNLSKGVHLIVVKAVDAAKQQTLRRIVFAVFAAGYVVSPVGLINERSPKLSVKCENYTIATAEFYIDNISIHPALIEIFREYANCSVPFLLSDGQHLVRVVLRTIEGKSFVIEWSFEIDATPPLIIITYPINANLPLTYKLLSWINGTTEPGCKVYIDGAPITVDSSGNFSTKVNLVEGLNVFNVEAIDMANNTASIKVTILALPTILELSENITKIRSIINWLNSTVQENITNIYNRLNSIEIALKENITRLENSINENVSLLKENITELQRELYEIADRLSRNIENLRIEIYNEIEKINNKLVMVEKNVSYLRNEVRLLWRYFTENISALNKFLYENYTTVLTIMKNITELLAQLKALAEVVESLQDRDVSQDAGINLATALSIIAIATVVLGIIVFLIKKRPKEPQTSQQSQTSIKNQENRDTTTLDSGLILDSHHENKQ